MKSILQFLHCCWLGDEPVFVGTILENPAGRLDRWEITHICSETNQVRYRAVDYDISTLELYPICKVFDGYKVVK